MGLLVVNLVGCVRVELDVLVGRELAVHHRMA
jgi:hypothetical protein